MTRQIFLPLRVAFNCDLDGTVGAADELLLTLALLVGGLLDDGLALADGTPHAFLTQVDL